VEFRLKRVGIFAATPWERHAIQQLLCVDMIQRRAGYRCVIGRRGNCRVFLIQTGIGPARALAVCRAAFQEETLDLAISSGLACALTASSIGELLIGEEVMRARNEETTELLSGVTCDKTVIAIALQAAHAAGLPARAGRFISLPRIIWRADDKRRVAADTGAIALDMESGAIGAVAAQYHVPFAVIRSVSDLLDEDLPMDFNLFLEPTDWWKGVWTCVAKPTRLLGLRRLRNQMRTASQRITTVFEKLLDEVGGT
jgi:adenosylhomocysteine nucleosidase